MTKKVITYGTFDTIHRGHIRLLERAKALGDYLIVAVTSDDFDRSRGKINALQSLEERIENVKNTGLADKIIVEEYEGQKIDDVIKYGVDIFTVGSDWVGKFDYLKDYCEVIYLERTPGVSSTSVRSDMFHVRLGFYGDYHLMNKHMSECEFVNGIAISGAVSSDEDVIDYLKEKGINRFDNYDELLENSDAVFIFSNPKDHYSDIKKALHKGKHVICQSPICLDTVQFKELVDYADQNGLVLMDAIKTNYSLAFNRMCLLIKTGKIGEVVSVDSTCTAIREDLPPGWNSMCDWGPMGLLPVFKILGNDPKSVSIYSKMVDEDNDLFSKIDFVYEHSIASVKIGMGVKSEGQLIVSGTDGYIYVPAPWWKTDYFEVRYEDMNKNRRYFYELFGEGIRMMLHEFVKAVMEGRSINHTVSESIVACMDRFHKGERTEF